VNCPSPALSRTIMTVLYDHDRTVYGRVGFLLASALFLGCGLALQSAVRRVPAVSRIFGGGVALAGAALFFV
jgi:hypothetical protein